MNLLDPYKYVLDAVIIAALIAGGFWLRHWDTTNQQGIGEARIQAMWDKENLRRDTEKRTAELAWQKQVDDARIEGSKNVQVAQAAATAANSAVRMSNDTIKTILARSASDSLEANRRYTTALAAVFSDCQERYRALAEKADGHAIDSMTCQSAWPK